MMSVRSKMMIRIQNQREQHGMYFLRLRLYRLVQFLQSQQSKIAADLTHQISRITSLENDESAVPTWMDRNYSSFCASETRYEG